MHIHTRKSSWSACRPRADKAVENACKAKESIRNIDWFEVMETRGHVVEGRIAHWQVVLKVGFRLD